MIPKNEWSCITKPQKYIFKTLPLPKQTYGEVFDIKNGPSVIGVEGQDFFQRMWICYQREGNVYIRGAVDANNWSAESLLFAEASVIESISFTFDQFSRVTVFYAIGTNLYLYYFDSVLSAFTKRLLVSNAYWPVINFDYITEPFRAESDVMLYYVKDDTIFMRIQRDRFDIEYDSDVSYQGIKIQSCGKTANNRFQVIYTYPNYRDGRELKKVYITDGPVINNYNNDTFEVGFEIKYSFLNKCSLVPYEIYTLFEQTKPEFTQPDATINVSLVRADASHEYPTLVIWSGDLSTAIGTIPLSTNINKGVYRFVFTNKNSTHKTLTVYKNGNIIGTTDIPKIGTAYNASAAHRFKFMAADEPVTLSGNYFWRAYLANIRNPYIITNGNRIDWPLEIGQDTSVSVPAGNNLTRRLKSKTTIII